MFRGDRWYALYANKTCAGNVMSDTVRLILFVAATGDMVIQSLDVNTAFLFGDVPENQDNYLSRPAGLSPILACMRKSTLVEPRYIPLYISMTSALQQVINHSRRKSLLRSRP